MRYYTIQRAVKNKAKQSQLPTAQDRGLNGGSKKMPDGTKPVFSFVRQPAFNVPAFCCLIAAHSLQKRAGFAASFFPDSQVFL